MRLVFSIKASVEDNPVLAIATRMYSIIDPVLPPGYGFCIMNAEGEVLFHSETKRNTQENFLEEVAQNEKIRAAVAGRLEKSSIENFLLW